MTRLPQKPNLIWRKNRKGVHEPYFRVTWTDGGKERRREIKLDWRGDEQRLDAEYWKARAGKHPTQIEERRSPRTWGVLVKEWRTDPREQSKLAASTRASYRRHMDSLLRNNEHKAVSDLTRADLRSVHSVLAPTPRKADWRVQMVSKLWNYAVGKLDWPLGPNPARNWDFYGTQSPFEPWPQWMVDALPNAPENVQTIAVLILGKGERPGASVQSLWSDFDGEWMKVRDEKGVK